MKKIILIGTIVVAGVLLYLFQPWRLWTKVEANDPAITAQQTQDKKQETATSKEEKTQEPKLLKSGTFRSIFHETKGQANIYQLPNGKKVLRLENLESSDGPDVKVIITPEKNATSGWEKGKYFKISDVKATHGNVNYDLPDELTEEDMGTLVIWCERFNESFGAADLK